MRLHLLLGAVRSSVHDVFDLVSIERSSDAPVIMSTWHEKESLEEALWFALVSAYPVGTFAEQCGSVVAIAIGSPGARRSDSRSHGGPTWVYGEVVTWLPAPEILALLRQS
ncbi:MAG: DUF7684 family protein [Myxococcota bacterium]